MKPHYTILISLKLHSPSSSSVNNPSSALYWNSFSSMSTSKMEILKDLNRMHIQQSLYTSLWHATRSRYWTSRGLTRPERKVGIEAETGATSASFIGQFPAPWQLKTPTTPDNLFKFHILIRLHNSTKMTIVREL